MRLLSSLLLVAGLVHAQDEAPTFRADTQIVLLQVSVLDKKGNLVTDLPQGAFKVFENGVEHVIRHQIVFVGLFVCGGPQFCGGCLFVYAAQKWECTRAARPVRVRQWVDAHRRPATRQHRGEALRRLSRWHFGGHDLWRSQPFAPEFP